MTRGTLPRLFVAINILVMTACVVQAAFAIAACPVREETCPVPPPGCTAEYVDDSPKSCCSMYNSGTVCCSWYRQKVKYTGTCPGMPTNCSQCIGPGSWFGDFTCNAATGFCE